MNRGTRSEVVRLRLQLQRDYARAAALAGNQAQLASLLDAVLDEVLGGGRYDEDEPVPIDLYASRYRLVCGLRDLRCEGGDEAVVELLSAWEP